MFEERNIRQNQAWMQELVTLGARGTPATVVGTNVVVGFDRQRLRELIQSRGSSQ